MILLPLSKLHHTYNSTSAPDSGVDSWVRHTLGVSWRQSLPCYGFYTMVSSKSFSVQAIILRKMHNRNYQDSHDRIQKSQTSFLVGHSLAAELMNSSVCIDTRVPQAGPAVAFGNGTSGMHNHTGNNPNQVSCFVNCLAPGLNSNVSCT